MKLRTLILACLTTAVVLPAVAETPPHLLAGKILDTRTGALTGLTDPALIPALLPCGAITLLGEVHDNPDHHIMRAQLIKAATGTTASKCAPSAFVFEHINADQQLGLDKFSALRREARRPATASDLFRFLEWDKSGWPASKLYAPLIREVLRSKAWILAGNPARASTRRVAKEGLGALDRDHPSSLGLDQPLAASLYDDLLTELEASHCGLMPKTAFGNMAVAQRYRDAQLADVALKAAASTGTVIIFAGNGHIRADRGVPYYIWQRAPNRQVITVAFVETEDGKIDPTTYGSRSPDGQPISDYVAFAAPAPRGDPCEGMREQFKAKPAPKL